MGGIIFPLFTRSPMKHNVVLFAIVSLLASAGWARAVADADWPEFRGPRGDGTSDASVLPLEWSEGKNIVWKTAIHGRGWSTPAVAGGRVWVTTATADGKEMSVLAIDLETGRIVHDRLLFRNESPKPLGNPVNAYASPSPAAGGGRVFAHFGSYGTAALDGETGKVIWERRDLPCDHFRGPGSSPVLHGGLLILTMDGFDVQYLAALDLATGKTVWKKDRSYDFGDLDGDLRKAYSTPLFIEAEGKTQMVSTGAKATYAYDPRTGEEIWRVRYGGFSNASRPVFAEGLVLVNTGFGKADLWAVRPDGRGDITETHVAWKCTQGVPLKPSPVAARGLVFMASDTGIASCLDARTGESLWKTRLGGEFSASPVLGAGRVYFPSEGGETAVVRADRKLEVLAMNRLDEGCMASPAVSGKSLILRTRTHLYRIE
jgi:outer membrane protein assembly factor BamB